MPLLRIKEIRDMSPDDRAKKLGEFRTELLRLKTMIGAGGTVDNPARVKMLRKTMAKILTIEHEEKHRTTQTESKKAESKKTESKESESEKVESAKKAETRKRRRKS